VFKGARKTEERKIGGWKPDKLREGIGSRWQIANILGCREGEVCQLYTMRETHLAHVVRMGPDVTNSAI
jgi:hypothetical protein